MKLCEIEQPRWDGMTDSQVRADAAQHQLTVIKDTLERLRLKYPDSLFVYHHASMPAGEFEAIELRTWNQNLNFTVFVEKDKPKLAEYCKKLVARLKYCYDIMHKHYTRMH